MMIRFDITIGKVAIVPLDLLVNYLTRILMFIVSRGNGFVLVLSLNMTVVKSSVRIKGGLPT